MDQSQKKTRLDFQTELEEVLGSSNVYFSPPESVKLKYPCIVYQRSSIPTTNANNRKYLTNYRYTVTLITKDPDALQFKNPDIFKDEEADSLIERLLFHFAYCTHDRTFSTDNLMHDVFTIYY